MLANFSRIFAHRSGTMLLGDVVATGGWLFIVTTFVKRPRCVCSLRVHQQSFVSLYVRACTRMYVRVSRGDRANRIYQLSFARHVTHTNDTHANGPNEFAARRQRKIIKHARAITRRSCTRNFPPCSRLFEHPAAPTVSPNVYSLESIVGNGKRTTCHTGGTSQSRKDLCTGTKRSPISYWPSAPRDRLIVSSRRSSSWEKINLRIQFRRFVERKMFGACNSYKGIIVINYGREKHVLVNSTVNVIQTYLPVRTVKQCDWFPIFFYYFNTKI